MNAESIDSGFAFGPFRLFPWRRLLMEGDRPVKLGSRALELLTVLVENAGEIVGKAQLMTRLWPHIVVEEAALRVHMAALRRILGDGHGGRRFIATVSQRGYSFVAPVHPHRADALSACTCGAGAMAQLRAPLPNVHPTGHAIPPTETFGVAG